MSDLNQPLTTKYIDPLTDYGFRFYFLSEPRKEILIEFLNDLFEGERFNVPLVVFGLAAESQVFHDVFPAFGLKYNV